MYSLGIPPNRAGLPSHSISVCTDPVLLPGIHIRSKRRGRNTSLAPLAPNLSLPQNTLRARSVRVRTVPLYRECHPRDQETATIHVPVFDPPLFHQQASKELTRPPHYVFVGYFLPSIYFIGGKKPETKTSERTILSRLAYAAVHERF